MHTRLEQALANVPMMLAAAMRRKISSGLELASRKTLAIFSVAAHGRRWAETADATDAMPNLKQLVESGLPRTRRKSLRVVLVGDLVREPPPIAQIINRAPQREVRN